jgi:hypothetical protein
MLDLQPLSTDSTGDEVLLDAYSGLLDSSWIGRSGDLLLLRRSALLHLTIRPTEKGNP